jgi:glycosyltransferase involved in cell wall biosynthesis
METKSKVPVSVIIPNFNRADLVGQTISCILAQTVEPLEIIVVDDGSTDSSREVISAFSNRVKLITQANQGPGAARNAGFRASSGEFIWFMDSDDLASENKIEAQYRVLSGSTYDFAYCPWIRCSISDDTMRFCSQVLQAEPLPDKKPMLEWFLSGWSLVFQNCLFRRSAIEKAGPYRTDLMPSEDSELFIRILRSGAEGIFTPDCMVFYREHNSNKITGAGTTGNARLRDWTNFLTITGQALAAQLPSMKFSTKLALSSSVRSHLRACRENGLVQLESNHPYLDLIQRYPAMFLIVHDLMNRVERKIKGYPDFLTAFRSRRPGPAEAALAEGIGYKTVF